MLKCGLLNAKEVYSILVEYWNTIEYTFNILLYVLWGLAAAEVALCPSAYYRDMFGFWVAAGQRSRRCAASVCWLARYLFCYSALFWQHICIYLFIAETFPHWGEWSVALECEHNAERGLLCLLKVAQTSWYEFRKSWSLIHKLFSSSVFSHAY